MASERRVALVNMLRKALAVVVGWPRRIWTRFIWLLLRTVRVGCEIKDVRCRCYTDREEVPLPDFGVENPPNDELLHLSMELYACAERRRAGVDEKIKSLLTLSGLLLPLSVALLPKVNWLCVDLLPVGFLFLTVALLIEYLGVGTGMTPSLDRDLVALPKNKRKSRIILDYLKSSRHDQRSTDFLVDVFKAARTMFILALISAMMVVVMSEFMSASSVGATIDGIEQSGAAVDAVRRLAH